MAQPEEQRRTLPPPSYTQHKTPNPGYRLGQRVDETPEGREWLKGLEAGWLTVDPDVEDSRRLNGLMLSGILPRPVAFVSTVSPSGVENLAPFSWFNQVSAKPPVIVLGCSHAGGKPRDTGENIKATGQFTVNIISEPWLAQANTCAIECPANVSEWPMSGLTKEPSTIVKPPRVRESAFSLECELLHEIPIYHTGAETIASTVIIGQVKMMHIRKDTLNERGVCDPGKLKPISRLGGISFSRVTEGFELPRMSWADAQAEMKSVNGVNGVENGEAGKGETQSQSHL
ncbi:hypothetical protein AX16_007720 [Volvariella volvacea WC 439]|nr:hypothetical protein AX16_007720 [Volvariella volvacea WC 439]